MAQPSDVTTGDEQYDYVDKTDVPPEEKVFPGNGGTEATQAELNPAYYPAANKPEALLNEAEKKGAEFPGGTHLQAALAPEDPEAEGYDPTDPETANPPAPGAALSGGHAATVTTTDDESSGNQEADQGSGGEDEDDEGDDEDPGPDSVTDGTVDEVLAHAEENPDQVDDLLAEEKAGKNRSTLVAALEKMQQ